MKKHLNLLAVLLMVSGALFVTSCDENDDDGDETPNSNSPIVGEWEYKSADIMIEINDQDIIDYFVETFEIPEDSAAKIKAQYVEIMNDFDGWNWTFSADNKYEVDSPEPNGDDSGTWSLSSDNKKLTLTSDGESEVIDVKTLTSNTLQLYYEETFEAEDMDEDGQEEEFFVSVTLELEK